MRIGCCCPVEQAELAAEAGFDYLECRLTSLLPEADDAAFAPVLEVYRRSPLPVEVFNVFLPGDLAIVGPQTSPGRVARYVETALPRARQVGAGILVLGSGRSRNVPAGFSADKAREQFVSFLNLVAQVAEYTGHTVAIEPLNFRESNLVNSVAEAADMAAAAASPHILVLADFYHMDEVGEPLEHLVDYREWLAHVHVADSGRGAPGTGAYPYDRFARLLLEAGYIGRVSVECSWDDFAAQAGPSVQFLRTMLNHSS